MFTVQAGKKFEETTLVDAGLVDVVAKLEKCAALSDRKCTAMIATQWAGAVLHGNNTVNCRAVPITWCKEESVSSNVVKRHSFGKNHTKNVGRL